MNDDIQFGGFDAVAETYDEQLDRGLSLTGESKEYFIEGRMRCMARHCDQRIMQIRRVLDFGCGLGATTVALQRLFDAECVIGVDTSQNSVRLATQAFASSTISFYTPADMPATDEFDLVYCNGVFHHIMPDDRPTQLQWIQRRLKVGGLFAMWENNPWNPAVRLIMSRVQFDRDAVLVYPREAIVLLERSGFSVRGLEFCFVFPRWLSWLRPIEYPLRGLPIGGQYMVLSRKVKPVPA
jgi:SAM-dependent methyltransferase